MEARIDGHGTCQIDAHGSAYFYVGGRWFQWPHGTRHGVRDNTKLGRWRAWVAAFAAPAMRRLGVLSRWRCGRWPLEEMHLARLFIHTLSDEIHLESMAIRTRSVCCRARSIIWHLILRHSSVLVFDASALKMKRYLYLASASRATRFAVAESWRLLAQRSQQQVTDAAHPVYCGMLERMGLVFAKSVRAHMSLQSSSGPSSFAASAVALRDK